MEHDAIDQRGIGSEQASPNGCTAKINPDNIFFVCRDGLLLRRASASFRISIAGRTVPCEQLLLPAVDTGAMLRHSREIVQLI